ncbi:deoxycytidylate deaminase-like [Mercenaria mercenaria]|uniref:deoxycytidylate deaminase-like n=1 Tax=Mercenaria mercenaria TaxID=6596 RepID=UPI00234EA3C4|nr:deoxycytidylate deaminase-like [Mercenaria mercenaria]
MSGKLSNEKRPWYISWDEYFMGVALITAQRSKDPVTQVGSCIVNADKRIISTGYNGMPNGCSDDTMPWGKHQPDKLRNKQLYVCHSEMNAILNKISSDVRGCTLYVTLFPCNQCAKIIIQTGIKEVVYYDDKHHYKIETKASKLMLETAGVKTRQYAPSQLKLRIGHIESKL